MTTLNNPWAQHFDPKNFSVYALEALSTTTEPGVITREFDLCISELSHLLVGQWLSNPREAKKAIEKKSSELSVKLLIITLMPHFMLRVSESFVVHAISKESSTPGSTTGGLHKSFIQPVTAGAINPLYEAPWSSEEGYEAYLEKELDNFAEGVFRLLKNVESGAHKLSSGLTRKYSPELRLRFLALNSVAIPSNHEYRFITVNLSEKESENLLKGKNKRSLEQKLNARCAKALGPNAFAGFTVIEASPSKDDKYHLHSIVATSKLTDIQLEELRIQLKSLAEPGEKSAVNIKNERTVQRLKRPDEIGDTTCSMLTKEVLPGIDMGVVDYLSKDLTEELIIGLHLQVFGLRPKACFDTKLRTAINELLKLLFSRAKETIQLNDKTKAIKAIKRCILALISNLWTKIFKRNIGVENWLLKNAAA